jgi:alkyl hydroperoxide reductase subunit F
MLYDLIIIGGGPAGVSAGVYAARKQLNTAFITFDFGGQSIVSDEIQNWIGTPKISGPELAKNLEEHLKSYSGDFVKIFSYEWVLKIEKEGENFVVITDKEKRLTKTILIATGSHRRKLEVKGAMEFENKGITYCASCDGPLFAGKDVVVVGGGNAAFESASQLLAYCNSVTLLNRSDKFKADEITVEKLRQNPKLKIITNAIPEEVFGDKFVNGLSYKNTLTGEITKIDTTGIFVEIGAIPTTEFAKEVVELNQYGSVVVDPRNQRTKTLGIWSAGDCTDGLYHQNNIASGDAVKALEDIYIYLQTM